MLFRSAGPGPIQGGPQLVGGPVAPTGPMPNLPATVDQAVVQNFLNQGYTQQQIQAAVDANPNGGWGRSLMWGEQGAPGATPPSLVATSAPVAPPTVTPPTNIVSTGISDSAPGTIYNGPAGPEVVLDSGKTVNLADYQAAQASGQPITVDGQVQTQYRVEVSGTAHYADVPPPAGTELPPNTRLATADEMAAGQSGSGPAVWDVNSSSWVVPQPPAPLTPVVPAEIPITEAGAVPTGPVYNPATGMTETVTPGTGTSPVATVNLTPTPAPVIPPTAPVTAGGGSLAGTVGAGAGAGLSEIGRAHV